MTFVGKSPTFAFEAGQRHGRYAADIDLEAKLELQLLGDSRGLLQIVFDLDDELVHRAMRSGGDSVFDDLGKAVQDLLDRGGVDVHAADDEHVVGAAQDSAVEQDKSTRAAGVPSWANEIACAIADDGCPSTAECGEY